MTTILSPNEIEAFKIMTNAVEALRSQYNTPRYAIDRRDELKDCLKLFMAGVWVLVSEAEGDANCINVPALLSDLDDAFTKIIEQEEGREVPNYRARLQRHYGTYHVVSGRVS